MKKISIKKLQKKIEHIVRDYLIKTRNDGKCELCLNKATEADHCFSRTVKQLFFNLSNLTAICRGCHVKKTHRVKAYDLEVYEFVKNREGVLVYDKIFWIAKAHVPFPDWSKRQWLENKLKWAEGLSDQG